MLSQMLHHELELTTQLQARIQQNPTFALYGLIDGVTPSALFDTFFLLEPEAEYCPLFLGTEYEPCLPASPYLVRLQNPTGHFMQEYGSQTHYPSIWFLSPYSLESQWRYWRSLLEAISPQGETAMFRFWHGAILGPYIQSCSDDERNRLLQPCRWLYAPEQNRHWREWQLGATDQTELNQTPDGAWWEIRPEHLKAFAPAFDDLLADAILDTLWQQLPEVMAAYYPAVVPVLIRNGITQARALGLRQDNAITVFVQCRFRWNDAFWRHPRLDSLWQQSGQTDAAFLDWAGQYPVTDHRHQLSILD